MLPPPSRYTIYCLINKKLPEEQGIVDGVRAYATGHQVCWDIVPLDVREFRTPNLLNTALPHGVFIGRPRPVTTTEPLSSYPWINWGAEKKTPAGDAAVGFDAVAIGRVACEYFRLAGARSLAVFRADLPAKFATRLARIAGFRASAAAAGLGVHVLCDEPLVGEPHYQHLREVCAALPKPIGVFCYHDKLAAALIDDLLCAGLAIPQDVMVLGGNGSAAAAQARIPISSVRLPYMALGRAAASLAHQLFSGTQPEPRLIEIAPAAVVERASTAVAKRLDDPLLKQVMKRVAQAKLPLPSVEELARHCGCNRQLLFRHFHRELGCSPQLWLQENAMQRAARLLADTDHDLSTIAKDCGFAYAASLSRQFKKRYGITPSAFRSMER